MLFDGHLTASAMCLKDGFSSIYGVTVVQTYVYVFTYKQDETWVKSLVYAVTYAPRSRFGHCNLNYTVRFLETVHSIIVFALYYDAFIAGAGHLETLPLIPW